MSKLPVPLLVVSAAMLVIGTSVFALSVQADGSSLAAHAGEDMTVECTSPQGALVALNGNSSTDSGENDTIVSYEWIENNATIATGPEPAVTLALGQHDIMLRVMNSTNETRVDNVTVVVQDTTAPTLTAALVGNATLWPPNHKMRDFSVDVHVSDACTASPTFTLASATSDEADDGTGDGHTSGDVEGAQPGTPDTTFTLRAERAGPGDGRTYTLLYEAHDASGNVAHEAVEVVVPHDMDQSG